MDGVVLSGSKTRLLKYVRLLRYRYFPSNPHIHPIQNLLKGFGAYLSALHNIRNLELDNISFERINAEELRTCFSAFRETLTDLTLALFATSFDVFVTLIGYLPNITALRLGPFVVKPDEGPVPQLSRTLRGKIHLFGSYLGCAEFFNRLAKLNPEYEELGLENDVGRGLLNSILQLSANTVKYLRLAVNFQREYPYNTPSLLHITTRILTF